MRVAIGGVALVTTVACTAAAQAPAPSAPAASLDVTIFVGGGAAFPGSQPSVDRSAGAAYVGGVEVARPTHAGLLGHVALRAEGGFASQSFDLGGGVARGDVQTPHAALALSVALLGQAAGRRSLLPYVVAGGAWARPSTRLVLQEDPRATPGARFEQVTHESVPGALVGGGVAWQRRRLTARAEVRWLTLATDGGATTTVPVVVTLGVPFRR